MQINITASEDLKSSHSQVQGSLKARIEANHDMIQHVFIDYVVEERPTSQCHVMTSGHFITFDEKKFQFFEKTGWFVLHKNTDFYIEIQLENCGAGGGRGQNLLFNNLVCLTGLKAQNGHNSFQLINKTELKIQGSEINLNIGRNGSLLYVSIIF
jgi:hypothetical protein